MKRHLICFLGLILFTLEASFAHAESLHIAVASNFALTMKELANTFERKTGHHLKLSFGSSGKLYAQLLYGAPFQVFFSADQEKPIALESAGLIAPGSRFTYAEGKLVLWSRQQNLSEAPADRLRGGQFNKLALANPKLAPYGKAAVEVLEHLQLKETTRPHWILGENIAQTYQFVDSGNVDFGFVALSQIKPDNVNKQPKKGFAWHVPTSYHSPIRQDVVLLKKAEKSEAARALMAFIRSETAQKIIQSHGYNTLKLSPANPEP